MKIVLSGCLSQKFQHQRRKLLPRTSFPPHECQLNLYQRPRSRCMSVRETGADGLASQNKPVRVAKPLKLLEGQTATYIRWGYSYLHSVEIPTAPNSWKSSYGFPVVFHVECPWQMDEVLPLFEVDRGVQRPCSHVETTNEDTPEQEFGH